MGKKKESVSYEEVYRKPGVAMLKKCLPYLNQLQGGRKCIEANVLKNALVERDGKEFIRQEMVVYWEVE